MKFTYLFLFTIVFSLSSQAKIFSNSYISFQLPPTWNCSVAGTEWVCRSTNKKQAREAIIVLTAKEVGPNDNFAYYTQYLKTPKTPKNRDGSVSSRSKVIHMKTVQVAKHQWVDSLHLGSLLPKFYSRYLVTIKNKVAILVTFNAKKEYYTRYSQHFFNAIRSLKVTAKMKVGRKSLKGANEALGVNLGSAMGDEEGWGEGSNGTSITGAQDGSNGGGSSMIFGLAFILAALGGYFLYKRYS